MPNMPPIPDRMKRFPLWKGMFPIFYTVARTPEGKPEFRKVSRARQIEAERKGLCHLCGQTLWTPFWFICYDQEVKIGRSKDGPMHKECAEYACKACPFLSQPGYVGHDPREASKNNPLVLAYLDKHPQMDAPPVRPARMALCSASRYKSDLTDRYPVFSVVEWDTMDWDILTFSPEKPDA
jgi:hypothetical protein